MTTASTKTKAEAEDSLRRFFERGGRSFPELRVVSGNTLREPYKSLLVHQRDMTSTLERFHKDRIHLRVRATERQGEIYFREVLLLLDANNRIVEFGIIQMHLDRFEAAPVKAIQEEKLPLGRILNDYAVPYTSSPQAFFEVSAEEELSNALGVKIGEVLYGRRNFLLRPDGRRLADIVEILPPEACNE